MIKRIFRYIKRHIALFLVNKVLSGTNPKYFSIKRKLLNSIGYNIGSYTKVVGPVICTGRLTIGKNCWIGTGLTIHGNGDVIIGNNVDIGPEVTFITGSHLIGKSEHRAGLGLKFAIEVGNGCWIGSKSILTNTITIGNGTVIAAGAVVCKDVSPNVLIGGVPAKTIKLLDDE